MDQLYKEEIVGVVSHITYQNDENGYTVAKLKQYKKSDLTTIVGILPSLQPGETVRIKGQWKLHLVHGKQFEVTECQTQTPASANAIKKYLGSGLIKGIGPKYAKSIVDIFGLDTLNIIDSNPEKLFEVPGIGKKRIEKIKTSWDEHKAIRKLMLFLQSYDVSPAFSQKIYKAYGDKSIEKIQENPYQLAKDIFRIGFKTADNFAKKLGMANDSPQRIESGIEFVLSNLSSEGHVCYPLDDFFHQACQMLEVKKELVVAAVEKIKNEERVIVKEGKIWLAPLYHAEQGIATQIRRLKNGACSIRDVDTQKALEWVQKKLYIKLATNQKKAVEKALLEKLIIITGGPGTGKSTITKAILAITEKLTSKIMLAAPTGRAAKRMTEITKRPAKTIHSLLEYNFANGGFKHNLDNPLDCDLIIIDEASMIDTLLMNSLLKAVPSKARVVFVGDINQLPSVGPGNVLEDLINSEKISVTTLNFIFRQAKGSKIITNAHRINKGEFPFIQPEQESDFFFLENKEPETCLQTIVDLVATRVPSKYRFDPISEIQVLAPMKRGVIGTENLNQVLQDTLNPQETEIIKYGRTYRIGDKVMQIRNNYKKNIYNGDVGIVSKIDKINQELYVAIDEQEFCYDFSELDELVLAYAVSIHKYQGSECPCVIIPVHTSHFKLLNKNLLYTGVTRGKKLVILVGTKKALAIAVRTDDQKKRYTGLKNALIQKS